MLRPLLFSAAAVLAGVAGGKAWFIAAERGRKFDGWCVQGFIAGTAAVVAAAAFAGPGVPALTELKQHVGLAPEQILAASPRNTACDSDRRPARGARRSPAPVRRTGHRRGAVEGLSRYRPAGAGPPRPVHRVPGGARPGRQRPAVLTRLGLGRPARSYSVSYRQAQVAASARLPATVPALQRAAQLLRRHGQAICRRREPGCHDCAIAADCPSAGHPPPLY